MTERRRAAFLDRDGTLVVERHYLADPEAVTLVPGVAGALDALRNAGFALVVVTNQSGIARGLYTEAAFHAVQDRIERLLADAGVRLDAVYFCPHHPDYTGTCDCRKPATGLFERAAAALDLDLRRSVFIGDRLKDVVPARAFGARGVLVRTGYGALQEVDAGADIEVVEDIVAAAARVIGNEPDTERGEFRVDTPLTRE